MKWAFILVYLAQSLWYHYSVRRQNLVDLGLPELRET